MTKKTIKGTVRAWSFSLLFFFFLMELGCFAVVESGLIPSATPDYVWPSSDSHFLGDLNPYFGVWHYPNREHRQEKACFSAIYRTNSVGAVDRERSYDSSEARTIVLGDSFVEGVGVNSDERFTDIMEASTGREHLNFGTSGHFGPTQYYLLYKHLAAKYSHDTVLVMVLPDNDFDGPMDNRYVPYWAGTYPNYELRYSLDRIEDSSWANGKLFDKDKTLEAQISRILRHYTYTRNVYDWAKSILKGKKGNEIFNLSDGYYSGYRDYRIEELQRLFYSLQKIREAADGKRLIVVTIPRPADFMAVAAMGNNPLAKELTRFADANEFEYIDLLPLMLEKTGGDTDSLFHSCDGHWSSKGNSVAAELLEEKIYH